MHSKYSFQLRYWNWSRKGFKYFEWIIAAHFAAKVKKNISKYFITNLSRFQNCRLKSISTKLNYQRKFSAMAESAESNFAYSVSLWFLFQRVRSFVLFSANKPNCGNSANNEQCEQRTVRTTNSANSSYCPNSANSEQCERFILSEQCKQRTVRTVHFLGERFILSEQGQQCEQVRTMFGGACYWDRQNSWKFLWNLLTRD